MKTQEVVRTGKDLLQKAEAARDAARAVRDFDRSNRIHSLLYLIVHAHDYTRETRARLEAAVEGRVCEEPSVEVEDLESVEVVESVVTTEDAPIKKRGRKPLPDGTERIRAGKLCRKVGGDWVRV